MGLRTVVARVIIAFFALMALLPLVLLGWSMFHDPGTAAISGATLIVVLAMSWAIVWAIENA